MDDEGSVLRPWGSDDAEWYIAQLADPEIQRFTTESPTTTLEQFQRALDSLAVSTGQVGFAVVDDEDGALAGNVAAQVEAGVASVSYWLAPQARGKGLARRAVRELCRRIPATWPQIASAQLWVHVDNAPSAQVAKACGFRRDPARDETREVGAGRATVHWYTLDLSDLPDRP